jgi:O-antigen/teichoic acid export membrane protein
MSKFPRNLLTVYAAHGLNGIVAVVTIPIAVRLLGVSGYGFFSIYTVLVSYILLADFGVSKNLLRLLSEAGGARYRVQEIRVALGIYAVLCGVWFAVFPLLAFVIPRYLFPVEAQYVAGLRWMLMFSILEFCLGVPASLMQTACVASQRFDSYAAYSLASGFLRNAAILAGAFIFRSPVAIAALLAGRKLCEIALAGKLLGWLPAGAWRPIFDGHGFKAMLGQSVSLSSSQVLYSTAMSIGSPLVNAAFGLHGLGLYRAAYDLAGKIAFVTNGVTLVLFPRAARHFRTNSPMENTGRLLAPMLRGSAAVYACFAAAAVIAAPHVLPAMGLRDDSTIRLFTVLIVALSFNAHSLFSNELVQASGCYRYSIWFSASALLSLSVLFSIFKPFAGIMAIGWAWVGAALLSASLVDGFLLEICGSRIGRQVSLLSVKIVAAAGCLGLAGSQLGIVSNAVAPLCVLLLLALLSWSVWNAAPVLRSWRDQERPVEPTAPPVYV